MEQFFHLRENGTNVKTEIIAGITTFMTMAYIIFVNPDLLSLTGMDKGAVLMATCLASALATLFMGLFANYPFALAPGMGLNAFFTFGLVKGMGLPWQTALGAVFLSGLIAVLVTLTKLREQIIKAIPNPLKQAVGVGIGLFIALIGFKNAGIIVANEATLVGLGNMGSPTVLLALLGLLITGILLLRNVSGAILIGVLLTTVLGIPLGVTHISKIVSAPPSLAPTFLQLDIAGAFRYSLFAAIFSLFFVDLFDTIGTFVGVASRAGMIDEQWNLKRGNKALFADSIGTLIGSLLGTSNTTTYVESAAGVNSGGRTGLTAVTVAVLFLLSTFFAPLATAVPSAATAPALILVGVMMASNVREIDFNDMFTAIPAFLTMALMPFTFSIATGLAIGFISYVLLAVFSGRAAKVHPLMYVLAVLFVIYFFVQ